MANGPLGVEHPLVVTRNLDALAERYRAMGFAPTPKGYHPWGTANHLVVFPDSFIELISIEDYDLIDGGAPGFRLGRFISEAVNRREGVAMLALHSKGIEADVAALLARGIEDDGRVEFRRAVELPDGTTDEAAFSLAMLIDWDRPALSNFLCQQYRPELVWMPERMQHPNGAAGITRIVYAAAEPFALWSRYAGLWGEAALTELDNGFSVATAGGEILVLDRTAAEARFAPLPMPEAWRDAPCAVAISVQAPDIDLVHSFLLRNWVPHLRTDTVLRVPPEHAGNLVLEFAL